MKTFNNFWNTGRANNMGKFQEEKSQRRIGLLRKHEEEEVVKLLAGRYKIPYADLGIFPIETDAIKIISEETSRSGEMAIVRTTGKQLEIAVRKPDKPETITILNRLKEDGHTYELFLSSLSSLEHAWMAYKKIAASHEITAGAIQISSEKIAQLQTELSTIEQVKDRIHEMLASRISEALEAILAGALATDASDLHIEPQQDTIRLRFRLDGVLYDVIAIPDKLYRLLLSRIKLISELKLNIHDRAQDGRFTIKTKSGDIEVRTSTLPGPKGENVVLRILNPKAISVQFKDLGMQPWVADAMMRELNRPNGMILTTGPTGSGKTTTLYTFLRTVYNPTVKIITIEDPIEYHLTGLEQTQVDAEKGYDFASGLWSIVRQDPDIILVGEIRDLETAETAMHAALTGHLVFSTLHTNDAAGTIPRLIDIGVKPPIIAPALNITMAQRLVRKLCPECRKVGKIIPEQRDALEKEFKNFPEKIAIPKESEWRIYEATESGCASCSHTGYKGRTGIFEIIFIDDTVERLILTTPSEFDIKKAAQQQGQITLRQDGILKVLAGITDYAEYERVVGI